MVPRVTSKEDHSSSDDATNNACKEAWSILSVLSFGNGFRNVRRTMSNVTKRCTGSEVARESTCNPAPGHDGKMSYRPHIEGRESGWDGSQRSTNIEVQAEFDRKQTTAVAKKRWNQDRHKIQMFKSLSFFEKSH